MPQIIETFEKIKRFEHTTSFTKEASSLIRTLHSECAEFLKTCETKELISKVNGKRFFAYYDKRTKKYSRAINQDLFVLNPGLMNRFLDAMEKNDFSKFDQASIQKLLYSNVIIFSASIDLLKKGAQKNPGTYFEFFCSFLFSWRFQSIPKNFVTMPGNANLPTDLIIEPGMGGKNIHVPIKTSTRERSIMLWAHQKILDGAFGEGAFVGVPVLFAENKTSTTSREVVEICLPAQWRLYQQFVAKLKRVYYFDVPRAYSNLNSGSAPIDVRPISDIIYNWRDLIS